MTAAKTPPGTYVGNYADAEGNVLHGKHPWALIPAESGVCAPTPSNYSNPAAVLERLELSIFRLHVRFFPGTEYVDPWRTLVLLEARA